jgi:phosphoglucomutase
MGEICFGTDGWRARMGKELSFRNVRLFSQAYCNYLKKKTGRNQNVLINFDTRLLSKNLAVETAKILSINKIRVFMPNRDVPLAAISLAIIQNKFDGAINFTISLNDPTFSGIQVFNEKGAPALPSEISLVEREIEKIKDSYAFKPMYKNTDYISHIDVKPAYIEYIEKIIDFDLIRQSKMTIVVDNLFGTSREYLDYLLSEKDINIYSIHNFPFSSFGDVDSFLKKDDLKDLSEIVLEKKASLGLATDIDGGRFRVVDSTGKCLNANLVMPLLIEYLIRVRKMEGGIVKSISTTDNIKRVAENYLRPVYTTPVGFKYLADALLNKEVFVAVESTDGAALKQGIPIKDGILFNLLIAEMVAYHQLNIEKMLVNFALKYPKLYYREIAIRGNNKNRQILQHLIKKTDYHVDGFSIKQVKKIDGLKFVFKDGWLLLRESGTESLIRIYAESTSNKQTKQLIKLGRSLIE